MREDDDKYFILMIAGYKDELKRNFFGMNDGLERRFSIHFTMQSYIPQEMVQIFIKKSLDGGWSVEEGAITDEFIKSILLISSITVVTWSCFCEMQDCAFKNLLAGTSKIKRCISKMDMKDGIELFIKIQIRQMTICLSKPCTSK